MHASTRPSIRAHVCRRPVSVAVCVLLTLATGCVLKKPPDTAAIKEEALPAAQIPVQWTAAGAGSGPTADNWLVTFRDDQLTAAVAEAIAHNPDLRVGAARVEQALLLAKLAGARLYPSVDALARGGGKLSGDSSGLQGGVLTVSWELDLWGRVRYGRAAAAADAMSTQADFEYARQSMAALVARSWFLATEAGLQAELARGTIRDGDELVRLAETRTKVGVGNDEDVFVARANVGGYRDTLREIDLARAQAIRALELLLGRYPAAAATVSPALPGQPDAVPADLPSTLLERRPDVIAAERRIAAAFNRVHEAKAARLPAIALTTGVSSISSELFVLQDRDNPIWNFGANLVMPIFRGGRAQDPGRNQDRRAEAGGRGVCRRRTPRLRRGRVRACRGNCGPRARANPGTDAGRQPPGARHRANPVQSGEHRPEVRHATAARDECRPVGADPGTSRATRAARQPAPGTGRKLRAPAITLSEGLRPSARLR